MKNRAILLILIQCLLISSIAGKYLYERQTRPRVWVKAGQFDPNLPMRGRYLALSPIVNACGLPHDQASKSEFPDYEAGHMKGKIINWQWRVITKANDGKLVVEDARNILPHSDTQNIWLGGNQPCESARLMPAIDFFIPDTAKSPFPLQRGQELWVEVTVPPAGPPRAIQLAVSDNGQWKPLRLE